MSIAAPLVSVIVPCFNHEKFVTESLLSVINQSYRNVQLIVIDDGSTDNSAEVIRKIKKDFNFIFETQSNVGISATLNRAITEYANGKYIAILASDDFWHKDKLSQQVEFMEQNKDFAMVCSESYIIDSESNVVSEFDKKLFEGSYSFEEIAYGRCLIPALTTMIRKEIFQEVGLFDQNLIIEDMDMWLRIAYRNKIGVINRKLAFYRQHSTNVSSKGIIMAKSRFQILNKWKHIPSKQFKKMKRNWELQALGDFGKTDKEEAKKYFNPSINNFFNAAYRRFIITYYLKGHF